MKTTILLLFISVSCFAQSGQAKSYFDLSPADRLQRSIDSIADLAKKDADFIAFTKRDAVIRSLKSKAYTSLNGVNIGATLTTAQIQAVLWIGLWNTGAINQNTNKIDSTLNYIK